MATGNTVTRHMLRRASSVAKRKAAEVGGEGKLASKDSPEEYFSSRGEMERLEVVRMATGSEGAEYFYPNEDGDAIAAAADRE